MEQQAVAEGKAVLISLLQTMLTAMGDNNLRLEALKKLEHLCNNVPGTASLLMSIVLDKNLDETTRFMAVVQMKNLFKNQWTRKKSTISTEERHYLQKCMLGELLDEESQKISVQTALIISEVSDWDYPEYWPDFFSQLLVVIQSTNSLRVRLRGFQILSETVKKLVNRKEKSRINLLAPLLMKFVGQVWLKLSLAFLSLLASPELSGTLGGDGAPKSAPLEHVITSDICNMCLQMLCNLLVKGGYLGRGTKEPVVAEIITKMLEIWKNLVMFAQVHPNHILAIQIHKYIIRMAKFAAQAQEDYAKGFLPYVRNYLEFACTQIIDFVPGKLPDKYIIHNMIFLRAVVDKRKDSSSNSELYSATSTIFTRMFFSRLSAAMVSNYFPTTLQDMQLWEEKPEFYVSEERRNPWRHSRKACAETLFGSVIRYYPATVCPVIMELLQEIGKEVQSLQGQTVPFEHIQKKDAVYYAVALASGDIVAKLPFEKLLMILLPDIQNPDPRYKIIRYRIAFILECWARTIHSQGKSTNLQAVYEVLCKLMSDEDVAVKLAATCALRVVIDDQDFKAEDFGRFVEPSIQLICNLVPEIAEMESNLQLIKIIHVIIIKLDAHLESFIPKILECLTQLWQVSETDEKSAILLKSNILRTLNLIVKVLRNKAEPFYGFFLETVTHSTDLVETASLNLLEDGLSLWLSLLRFVPYNPQLEDVFSSISTILEFCGEEEFNIRRQVLRIIEAYIFMGGAGFLTKNLPGVVTAMMDLIDCVDDYQHRLVMKIIEQLLIRYPKEVAHLLIPLYDKLFTFLLEETDKEEGSGEKEPEKRADDSMPQETPKEPVAVAHDSTSLNYYLTLLRLLATDADVFLHFFRRYSQSHSASTPSPSSTTDLPTPVHYLYRFVDKLIVILSKTARVPTQEASTYRKRQEAHFRRLVVLSLSVLFASVLPKFGFTEDFGMRQEQLIELAAVQQRIICAVINAASVMIRDIHAFSLPDAYQAPVDVQLNLVEQARDQLEKMDPVGSLDIVQVFMGKVNELASTFDRLSKEQIMGSIDPLVLQSLHQLSSTQQ